MMMERRAPCASSSSVSRGSVTMRLSFIGGDDGSTSGRREVLVMTRANPRGALPFPILRGAM
jgi:hypothetical protein